MVVPGDRVIHAVSTCSRAAEAQEFALVGRECEALVQIYGPKNVVAFPTPNIFGVSSKGQHDFSSRGGDSDPSSGSGEGDAAGVTSHR